MRCDVIAEGIIAAAKDLQLTTPIVVRLQVETKSLARKNTSAMRLQLVKTLRQSKIKSF
jgi:succinyl-CoA synthetase beta subunit